MTTEQVIKRFLDGTSGSNGRIGTDGTNLYSYSTIIAFKEGGKVYVTQEKYSPTTTAHVSALYRAMDWPISTGETTVRPVSISADKTGLWRNQTERPAPYRGWKPRKGSVGLRVIDTKGTGELATFVQVAPRAV